jgi:branched-chain amino acid aminotransferase
MSTTETSTTWPNFDPDPNLKVWLNGDFLSAATASVSIFDHGLLYGDGVFEGIRSYNGRIFERHAHLKRLYASGRAIQLELPYSYEELDRALDAALAENGLLSPDKDSYMRLVASRGVGLLGMSPKRAGRPNVFIIATTLAMYPPEVYECGMAAIVSSITRNAPNATPPRIKSLNYLNNILAKLEAHRAGVHEAVMLNAQGHVAEATGDNVFVVRAGQLQTPPTSAGILEGITRGVVIRMAREAGLEVVEKNLERMDLYSADECFLTGTGAEIVPVTRIDDRPIGDGAVGPISRQMRASYQKLVRASQP